MYQVMTMIIDMMCQVMTMIIDMMYQVMTHHLHFFHVTFLLQHPPQIGDDQNQDLVSVFRFRLIQDVNC